MKTVDRSRSIIQSWSELVKTFYILFGIPFFLLISIAMTADLVANPDQKNVEDFQLFVVLCWSTIAVPVAIFVVNTMKRRSICKKIFNELRNESNFDPDPQHISYHTAWGKFIGIDIKNGTVLYIHRIRKGQVDVIGMNVGDWTHRELERRMLRLYTKFPQIPRLEIGTHAPQHFFDTLGAMEYKRYDYSQPFSAYVNSRAAELERKFNIQIPKLA